MFLLIVWTPVIVWGCLLARLCSKRKAFHKKVGVKSDLFGIYIDELPSIFFHMFTFNNNSFELLKKQDIVNYNIGLKTKLHGNLIDKIVKAHKVDRSVVSSLNEYIFLCRIKYDMEIIIVPYDMNHNYYNWYISYQDKIYHPEICWGHWDDLEERLINHTLEIFEEHGKL